MDARRKFEVTQYDKFHKQWKYISNWFDNNMYNIYVHEQFLSWK